MASPLFLVPPSSKTVNVRIIDTTASIHISMPSFVNQSVPSWAFLIEHPPSGRRILFDLGVRKDWQNLAPPILSWMKQVNASCKVEKDVRQILEEGGVKGQSLEAIIWSHWHWDHIGDPATFPKETALIVGPGFKKVFLPGYPTSPRAAVLETDFANREVREIDFSTLKLKIGRFDAFDYFGDGSFYLLDAPGHTLGHINGLARVTADSPSYILMGADSCYHAGEMRPSKYLPLPSSISPNPFRPYSMHPCPSSLFSHLLRDGDATKSFYSVTRQDSPLSNQDLVEETLEKVQEADGDGKVFVLVAHDNHVKDVIDVFPKYANAFLNGRWKEKTRWMFLKDLKDAVGGRREML